MNRADLLALVPDKILSGGRRTTASNAREVYNEIINSTLNIETDLNVANGYLGIDADGRVNVSFINSATASGLFLKDDGTWAAAGGGSVNPTSAFIPINDSGAFIDSFLSQDATRLFIDDGRTLTSTNGRSIIDLSGGTAVSISSTDIFANTSSIVINPNQINFSAAAYNIANITPDSYLYVDATGNLVPGTAPLVAAPPLADVIAAGGAMAGFPITSPDAQSTFIIANASAQLDWTDGTAQGQLYFNATNLGFAWSDGTESTAFNANATELEVIHSQSLIVNAPVINIGTRVDNTVINYGNSSTVHNFLGSALYEYQANQYVLDKLITLNYGGAVASGSGVGYEIEENSIITGYFKTNGSRNGFSLLSPAIAYKSDISLASLTADRVHTMPNASGTIALAATTLAGYGITDAQPLDSDLTTIAGLTATTDNFMQAKAGAWASRTIAQVKVDLGIYEHIEIDGGSYAVSSPADSTTVFMGLYTPLAPGATETTRQFQLPIGTVITALIGVDPTSTLGSNEDVTYYLRNITTATDYLLGTIKYDVRGNQKVYSGLNVSVASATDFWTYKIVYPAFSTNPTNCYHKNSLTIKLP